MTLRIFIRRKKDREKSLENLHNCNQLISFTAVRLLLTSFGIKCLQVSKVPGNINANNIIAVSEFKAWF